MITKNLDNFKITTTKQAITSFAGLPLLLGMAKNLGLEEQINALPLKERARGYKPAESAFAIMGLIQAGGEALDDISLLKGDDGLCELWGGIPAANTLGEWLRRFGCKTVHQLGRIQLATAAKVVRACKLIRVTLDVDAFFLESQKSDVEMNKCNLDMKPVAVILNDKELVRLLTHLRLPAEYPKFRPAPQAFLYEHACGPPDEDCQSDPKGDLYEVIDPAPADD